MRFSQIASTICESPTLRLNQVAARLRAAGEPVIHLGGGEPVTLAPPEAVRAAVDYVSTGAVRYAPAAGLPEMRAAIAADHARVYGVHPDPAHVIATGGAKQAIMLAMYALIDPGDEVLFPCPYWVSYPEMVKLAGGVPKPIVPADPQFHVTAAEIEAQLTPRTRMLLINSPNNPCGALLAEHLIRDIVSLCEQRGIWLVMDDIYHQLVFDGRSAPNPYATAAAIDDSRLIVVNGVSKTYAMTGFRLGWAVAARELVGVMASIQGQQTSGPSSVSQHAAIGALRGAQDGVRQLAESLQRNRGVMMECLARIPKARCTPPDGTFYCFPDFSAYEPDSVTLSNLLLEHARVVSVPGRDFGVEGRLRLSTCGSTDDIVEGVDRIRWFLDPAGPNTRPAGATTLRKPA